jgi:hypothetical protein
MIWSRYAGSWSARLLLRTKQTFREKDAEDRMFLEAKITREAK